MRVLNSLVYNHWHHSNNYCNCQCSEENVVEIRAAKITFATCKTFYLLLLPLLLPLPLLLLLFLLLLLLLWLFQIIPSGLFQFQKLN